MGGSADSCARPVPGRQAHCPLSPDDLGPWPSMWSRAGRPPRVPGPTRDCTGAVPSPELCSTHTCVRFYGFPGRFPSSVFEVMWTKGF